MPNQVRYFFSLAHLVNSLKQGVGSKQVVIVVISTATHLYPFLKREGDYIYSRVA